MRNIFFITLFFSLFCYANISYAQTTINNPHWYTIPDNRYDFNKPITNQEASEIVSDPIYLELDKRKDYYRIRRLELLTGIAVTQLKQNTGDAVLIGKGNLMPTIFVEGNLWVTRWFGVGANWTNVVLITFGSKEDTTTSNPVYTRPSWLDLYTKFRYMFDDKDGSSYVALKIGRHAHEFPISAYPDYITKKLALGLDLGVETKLAFNNMFGINTNLDFLWLAKLEDNSNVSNGQKGIGYKFGIDFYGTIMDKKGLKTMVSIGYGQISYISELHGPGINGDSRPALGVNHFEQTYNNIHLTFTARI
ncbi:MAG: hypothetical protein WCQ47_04695 [bacterium]